MTLMDGCVERKLVIFGKHYFRKKGIYKYTWVSEIMFDEPLTIYMIFKIRLLDILLLLLLKE